MWGLSEEKWKIRKEHLRIDDEEEAWLKTFDNDKPWGCLVFGCQICYEPPYEIYPTKEK
jgi:hypothetical protein